MENKKIVQNYEFLRHFFSRFSPSMLRVPKTDYTGGDHLVHKQSLYRRKTHV